MDVKSFSKSKVGFQHQRSSRRPETSKSAKKKTHHQHNRVPANGSRPPPSLPSNWDRYDDEEEEEASGPSSYPLKQETVPPKSKGADYSYLISEAQSQLRCVPSFHDILLQDVSRGLSSMLSARGKGFLSWGADDNFHVDAGSSLDYETSFFSLDLDILASELAKLEPSKRLFIEEEILPPSMRATSSKQNFYEHSETSAVSDASESLEKQDHEPFVADDCCSDNANLHISEKFPVPVTRFAGENDAVVSSRHDVRYEPPQEQSLLLTKNIAVASLDGDISPANSSKERQEYQSNAMKKPAVSRFEAAVAEAELDMLLDSFGKTALLDSFDFEGKTIAPTGPIGVVRSSSSSESVPSLSVSKVLDAFSGLSQKTVASTSLTASQLQNEQKAQSIENERKEGEKIGNPSLISLDDFDEWLDSI